MSAKSMFKRKAPLKEPRDKQKINEEYTAIAQQLGAKTVEAESIKRQIQQLLNKVDELGAEMQARTNLDEKVPKAPPQADAGVTEDVSTQSNNDQKVG